MTGMEERDSWRRALRKAVAESCAPRRNWRWMLASLGVGAGFGMVAGLQRLGQEPARMTPEVALTAMRAAAVFFVLAWLAVVAIRFGRLLRRASRN
jgi:hypothetical protein